MPQNGDGCSVYSWRCESPSREDMDGNEGQAYKKECKRCPVCMMILCEYHMGESSHMRDCNFRSNQERQLMEEKRYEEAQEKKQKQDDKVRLAKIEAEFKEREVTRHKNIKARNKSYKQGK